MAPNELDEQKDKTTVCFVAVVYKQQTATPKLKSRFLVSIIPKVVFPKLVTQAKHWKPLPGCYETRVGSLICWQALSSKAALGTYQIRAGFPGFPSNPSLMGFPQYAKQPKRWLKQLTFLEGDLRCKITDDLYIIPSFIK